MAAIKRAQAHQAAEHVGQMASEHAAVGVQFVDDDVLDVYKRQEQGTHEELMARRGVYYRLYAAQFE